MSFRWGVGAESRQAGGRNSASAGQIVHVDRAKGEYLSWSDGPMRTLLNIIWLVLSGFWLALGYALAGVIMTVLIVTIPFGIASFRLAGFVLWPFGRGIVRKPSAGVGSFVGNVLWFLLAGIWIAVAHVATAIALFVTIIGIPLAVANLKLAAVALAPLGKEIIDGDDPRAGAAGIW
jgi:uncharacterized membrane protein YccF (DUF307 family)